MGQSTCNLVPLLLLVLHAAVAVDCQSLDALRGAGSTRAAEPALGQRVIRGRGAAGNGESRPGGGLGTRQPDRNGRADFGASEDFNVSSALHRRSMRERVCWNGPALAYGGAPAGTPRPAYAGPPAGPEHRLMISGEGCASCTVGHVCTFFLHFASDAYFDTTLVMMRELLVLLTGPTTIYARAVPHHTLNRGGSSYLVSYKSWDAGTYAVKITSDCSKMADGVLRSNVLAQLSVEVRNDDGEGGELAGGGVGGGQVAGDEGGESAVRTPCEHGEYARWLLGGPSREGVIAAQVAEAGAAGMSGMWQYTPYTCAEGSTVQPQDFVGQLAAKGVHELSFVGDSHLRSICTHLQFLISGEAVPARHADSVWDYDDPKSGQHLRINYYWVDGVYHNGEFGCRNRGSYSGRPKDFPVYSPTSDVIVADGGAWSFQFCSEAERAYVAHLPDFLEWLVSRPHKHTARFVWRSEAPYPVPLENCWGRRNSALAWANEFARGLSTRYNFQYMDTWPIEAPRYLDTCYKQVGQQWVRDNHYSCPYDDNKKVLGDVGEAVVRYFMQALLHEYLV